MSGDIFAVENNKKLRFWLTFNSLFMIAGVIIVAILSMFLILIQCDLIKAAYAVQWVLLACTALTAVSAVVMFIVSHKKIKVLTADEEECSHFAPDHRYGRDVWR